MDWKILAKQHIFIDVNTFKKKKKKQQQKSWYYLNSLERCEVKLFSLINQLALVRTSAQALAGAWFHTGRSVPSPSSWCFRKPHGRARTTATAARNIPRPRKSTRNTILTGNGNSRGPGLKQSSIISSVQPASALPVRGKNKGNGLENELGDF